MSLCLLALYFTRLDAVPIIGEESRRATVAIEMIERGDWVVPRQQGQIYLSRPPMTSWLIALAGLARGSVDAVAVRLPSAIAVLLTALLIYGYARNFVSTFGALAAACVFATFGHVLQLGRMGESEAVFTFFLAAALLLWHGGYTRGWPPLATWMAGYAAMAAAAMVKGPQAPVYFGGAVFLYLALRRDWRYLVSLEHIAGIALAAAIVLAWQVPYLLATDWDSALRTWSGLASERFHGNGFLTHVATFPLETLACLLPWSPLLVAFASRGFRGTIGAAGPMVLFLTVAIAVSFPTLWFAAGARPRYFMPLYPAVALLIGLVIDRSVHAAADSIARRNWNRLAIAGAVIGGAAGVVVLLASTTDIAALQRMAQPTSMAVAVAIATLVMVVVVTVCTKRPGPLAAGVSLTTFCMFLGLLHSGVVINIIAGRTHDPTEDIAEVKRRLIEEGRLPDPSRIVSFGPIHHRFVYYYDRTILEHAWPESADDVPEGVEFFCFARHPVNRGCENWVPRGDPPIAWEEIDAVCVERQPGDPPRPVTVIGRILPRARVADDGNNARRR